MNLAAALVDEGWRVAVLDADPQQSAARWARQRVEGALPFAVHPTPLPAPDRLRAELERLGVDAELVILDTPPELEDAATAALRLADLALIPVTPSPLDLWATADAVEVAQKIRRERDGSAPLVSLVPYRLIVGTVLARDLPGVLSHHGEPVAPGIAQRVAVTEAAIVGQTVPEFAPESPAHEEFRALARHVLERLFR